MNRRALRWGLVGTLVLVVMALAWAPGWAAFALVGGGALSWAMAHDPLVVGRTGGE